MGVYEYVDTNAYFAQMWVQLDFDIIDLTFTKDDAVTIIPIAMSPKDIVADIEHPTSTQPEKKTVNAWWKIVLAVLLGILILILLLKLAPSIILVAVKAVLFIISVPFGIIAGVFKGSGSVRKHRQAEKREKKASEHKDKKKPTLADLDGMTDEQLAELYYEEYGGDEK